MPPESAKAVHFPRAPAGPKYILPASSYFHGVCLLSSLSQFTPQRGIGSSQIVHPTLEFLFQLPGTKDARGACGPGGNCSGNPLC
ncbi:Zinc finger protein [Musa troglodytarum]|uniref:Zinc finger protein n=1 Tax=Musa troglodytarum TaxID=320322 RepID=A0A9E7HCZ6_9LILI|nr:Zinc finger protein [Musa troglodytarum]